LKVASYSEIYPKNWQVFIGMGGNFSPELVAGLLQNGWQVCSRIYTRRYRTRKIHWKYVRIPLRKGELIEVDIKWVPGKIKGERYFQFTAIDVATRWRYLQVYEEESTFSALRFLKELIRVTHFKIKAIKTDNASCFTNRHSGYYKSV